MIWIIFSNIIWKRCIILYDNGIILSNNMNLMIMYPDVDLMIWYKFNDLNLFNCKHFLNNCNNIFIIFLTFQLSYFAFQPIGPKHENWYTSKPSNLMIKIKTLNNLSHLENVSTNIFLLRCKIYSHHLQLFKNFENNVNNFKNRYNCIKF